MVFVIFLLGISIGSFLNVLIDRLPKNKSVIYGRSYCDYCKHILGWLDLIPVVSFFILKRRCRYCSHPISWQYPIVELSTGLLYLFVYQRSVNLIPLIYFLIVISGLFVIFMTDLKYRIIPDQVLILLILVTFLFDIYFGRSMLANYFISGLLMFLFFLMLVFITGGKGMGLGDVKFSFYMGFLLGFPKILIAFYLAFLTGAVISIILVLARKKSMKSTIAFGPFLALATFISLIYGQGLWVIFKRIVGI